MNCRSKKAEGKVGSISKEKQVNVFFTIPHNHILLKAGFVASTQWMKNDLLFHSFSLAHKTAWINKSKSSRIYPYHPNRHAAYIFNYVILAFYLKKTYLLASHPSVRRLERSRVLVKYSLKADCARRKLRLEKKTFWGFAKILEELIHHYSTFTSIYITQNYYVAILSTERERIYQVSISRWTKCSVPQKSHFTHEFHPRPLFI